MEFSFWWGRETTKKQGHRHRYYVRGGGGRELCKAGKCWEAGGHQGAPVTQSSNLSSDPEEERASATRVSEGREWGRGGKGRRDGPEAGCLLGRAGALCGWGGGGREQGRGQLGQALWGQNFETPKG